MHVTSSPVDWYAARAAGIAAYLLLTAVVALGISLAGRAPGRRWRGWPMFAVEMRGLGDIRAPSPGPVDQAAKCNTA